MIWMCTKKNFNNFYISISIMIRKAGISSSTTLFELMHTSPLNRAAHISSAADKSMAFLHYRRAGSLTLLSQAVWQGLISPVCSFTSQSCTWKETSRDNTRGKSQNEGHSRRILTDHSQENNREIAQIGRSILSNHEAMSPLILLYSICFISNCFNPVKIC